MAEHADHVPLSDQLEAAFRWYRTWHEHLYGANPVDACESSTKYWMLLPKGNRIPLALEQAADVVGGTFDFLVQAIESGRLAGRTADEIGRYANWLLPRRLADWVRRGKRELVLDPDGPELCSGAPAPEDSVPRKIDAHRAIGALSSSDLYSITLDLVGYDGSEQAEILNISEAAARKRLSRSRERLLAAA
jgi:DNA-directed RNA polymerase specialized sigma24 family protein